MIIESDDQRFISKLTRIARSLKKQKSTDQADDLPPEVLHELVASIEDADKGGIGISNDEMLKSALEDFNSFKDFE